MGNRSLWGDMARNALSSWGAVCGHIPCYSEKILRYTRGRKCCWDLSVLFLCGSKAFCGAVNGNALGWLRAQSPAIGAAVRMIQWNLHLLERSGLGPALQDKFIHSAEINDLNTSALAKERPFYDFSSDTVWGGAVWVVRLFQQDARVICTVHAMSKDRSKNRLVCWGSCTADNHDFSFCARVC